MARSGKTFLGILLLCIAFSAAGAGQSVGPAIWPPPTVEYSVASPRVAISCAQSEPGQIAVAENFPRKPGTIKIPAGKRLLFHLSPNSEAVWYGQTRATALWELRLYMYRFNDGYTRAIENRTNEELRSVDDIYDGQWRLIGKDRTRSSQQGPAIARPQLGIMIPPERDEKFLGDYFRVFLLKATIKTTPDVENEPENVYTDDVYIRVVVTNDPIIMRDIEDAVPSTCPDMDNISFRDQQEFAEIFISTDFTRTGRTDLGDLAILAGNWLEKEMSLSDHDDQQE